MPTLSELLMRGWERHQSGRLAEAEATYRRVLEHAPNSAAAWCFLGILCFDQKRFSESEEAYARAVRLDPNLAVAWSNRSNTLVALERFEQAEASCRQALSLQPNYATAHLNLGAVLSNVGRWGEAEASFENALRLLPGSNEHALEAACAWATQQGDDSKDAGNTAQTDSQLDPRRFDALKNLGILQLMQGRFRDGWQNYEARFGVDVTPPEVSGQPWRGESLAGKSILICSEQGLGDTIHFMRFLAPLLEQTDQVVLACQKILLPLLANCAWKDRVTLTPRSAALPETDYAASLMSLPRLLGVVDVESIPPFVPYLFAEEERLARVRKQLPQGRKCVGLAWQGNPDFAADSQRSAPLEAMRPLWESDCDCFSLQVGPGQEQLVESGLPFESLSVRPIENLDSDQPFLDTAAWMMQLDAIVTTDTAIGHLAGALGRPVFLALSVPADWRWMLDRSDSPWYPNTRLFRQFQAGEWRGVFERIAAAISSL